MLQRIKRGSVVIVTSLTLFACQSVPNSPPESPKTLFSALDSVLKAMIERDAMVGVAAMVYKDGQEIYYGDAGYANREQSRPWQRDTLIAIYSMTKPVTGVTLMTLFEEGLFQLEDPLANYLPEYKAVRVLKGVDEAGSPILESPRRPLKVIDIFRYTACFGYGWEDHPASAFMNQANLFDPSKSISQFSKELAGVPLYCHPGEQWKYGVAVDVQARLAEVLSGKPFDELVQERVLKPLGMTDTGYFTPPQKAQRLASVYARAETGDLTVRGNDDPFIYGYRSTRPIQINGGHGLVSSIDDYMRFALMLQNEGSLNGVQILKPETVALMTRNHLPADVTNFELLPATGEIGFGLNLAVRVSAPADESDTVGVVGEYYWGGAASTQFWVDPKNDLILVFMTQVTPFDSASQEIFRKAVYRELGLLN